MRVGVFLAAIISVVGAFASAVAAGLQVDHAWVKIVSPSAKSAAVYMAIENRGDDPVRLVSVSTTAAMRAGLHRTEISADGIMRMRSEAEGILIPAHGEFRFKPGGHHIMLMGISGPLAPGALVPMVLSFDTGATVSVNAEVGDAE